MTDKYKVERLTVSQTHRDHSQSGRPGILGEAFFSWTVKRSDDQGMSIDEAKYVSLLVHSQVVALSLTDAVARGASDKATAQQVKNAYLLELKPVLEALLKKVEEVDTTTSATSTGKKQEQVSEKPRISYQVVSEEEPSKMLKSDRPQEIGDTVSVDDLMKGG